MKKIFNISLFAIVCLLGISLTACNDDDNDGVAKAVLASVSGLNFEPADNPGQIITVYSDAQWTCQHPDWIKVEPETGSGTTEVRISVLDNLRDGTPDNPRKADVVFKGVTKASEAHVIVRQSGDLFRDVQPITIAQMNENEDESVAIINNLTSVANLKGAVVATDGKDNVYIQTEEAIPVGTAFTIYSVKSFDAQKMGVLQAHDIQIGGTVSTLPEPIDITAQLDDTIKVADRTYVAVTGKLDGKNVVVAEKTNRAVVLDASTDVDLAALNGHSVVVYGFYSGTAAPAVNLYVSDVDDKGIVETVYFLEDFEWLEPWALASNAGTTVEDNNLDATAPALTSATADVNGVSVTAYKAIESKGYTLLYDKNDNKRIYLQRNYLKFGKTGNHGGITLAKFDAVPSDVHAELVFDWCPMRQASGKIDPVTLYVVIENGSDTHEIDIPQAGWENGHTLEWIRATVDLKGIKVDSNTRITITQREWEVGTANRWFLDNIKIRKVD